MPDADWRALCEELAGWIERSTRHYIRDPEVLIRARATLAAEAVGEGPTGDAAVEAVAELIYNQAMKWAATQPIPSDHINIPAWQQGGNSDAQEVARRTARAALAAKPLVKGPTDEELLELWQGWNLGWDPQKGMVLMPHPAEYARAVLARYGHQPAPPAAGEVGELVAWLRDRAESTSLAHNALRITRAADLLERQAAPVLEPALARINDILNDSGRILQTDELEALELARQALEQRHPAPVPVSERLPAMVTDGLRVAGDCDEQGRCWAGTRASVDTSGDRDIDLPPSWELREVCAQDDVWLPHYALPLPSGEVE